MHPLISSIGFAGLGLAAVMGSSALGAQLQAPAGGQVYALIVGINDYPKIRALKGALGDAQDFDETLHRAGVPSANINHIPEQSATRAAVRAGMDRLVSQTKAGDFVIITFAGHGMQVPESVKGSKPDHLDEAYLLYNFDRSSKTTPEMIIGPEMKHWLGQLDAKGVDVLYVVDSCFGGGMTRGWDPRSGEFTYRVANVSAEDAAAAEANLVPISDPSDSFRDESTFKHVTFLAAADKNTPSPEIDILGARRGALSYAVARAIDGAAARKDGIVTRDDLFAYSRQIVLQYSQERQRIVTEPASFADALGAVVWRSGTAAVQTQPANKAANQDSNEPIRVAVINGSGSALSTSKPIFRSFIVVGSPSDAQLVWDAGKKEALVAGDVIAQKIEAADVPAVVDRVSAREEITRLSQKAPQTIVVLPNNNLHRKGETVTVSVDRAQGKYAVIFNIAGDGTVQYLFPLAGDQPRITGGEWHIENQPVEPYGSDTVVAVTADQRLGELEAAISALEKRRAAGMVPQLLAKALAQTPSARLGLASVYTAP